MDRKALKKQAKKILKTHYWLLVIGCLIAGFIGSEYWSSITIIKAQFVDQDTEEPSGIEQVLDEIMEDNQEGARENVQQKLAEIQAKDNNQFIGRSRGVLSSVVNSVSSGGIVLSIFSLAHKVTHSDTIGNIMVVILAFVVYFLGWLFIQRTYLVILRRVTLEARTYEKVPMQRFLYMLQCKRWFNIAKTMLLEYIFLMLWQLTIAGAFIKYFSYFLVPYIVAENPNVKPTEAITLSRKMMDGHKWEFFVAELTFIGWEILSLFTFGFSNMFFGSPYKCAFFAEMYAARRAEAIEKKIPGYELLCDKYLYEKADPELLEKSYPEVRTLVTEVDAARTEKPGGFIGLLADWIGLVPFETKKINDYEDYQSKSSLLQNGRNMLEGISYPGKLAPAPMQLKLSIVNDLHANRSYTLVHMILLFFIYSFLGWCWEVTLHLLQDREFINRGLMHGPWLPIYGSGAVLILVLLKKFRSKPAAEFFAAIVVCGTVEYFTSWYLELVHDGMKWWDYSGYFLNLNGRICAEGLLTFGVGGMIFVYVTSPFFDNMLKKVNKWVLAVIAAILLILYTGDSIYSGKHPNTGKGITDYTSQVEFLDQNYKV